VWSDSLPDHLFRMTSSPLDCAHPETPDEMKCVSDLESSNFCQIKVIKHLSGGVVLYAAQTNALVAAELVKKGRFRTETRLYALALFLLGL